MGISTLLGRRRSALPRYYAEIVTSLGLSSKMILEGGALLVNARKCLLSAV
jgi:hypothetical protein